MIPILKFLLEPLPSKSICNLPTHHLLLHTSSFFNISQLVHHYDFQPTRTDCFASSKLSAVASCADMVCRILVSSPPGGITGARCVAIAISGVITTVLGSRTWRLCDDGNPNQSGTVHGESQYRSEDGKIEKKTALGRKRDVLKFFVDNATVLLFFKKILKILVCTKVYKHTFF